MIGLRAVALVLGAAFAVAQDEPMARDKAALQGVWAVSKMAANGFELKAEGAVVVFTDDLMTLTTADGKTALRFFFDLHPDKTPKQIDFSAPEPGKDKPPLPGLYRIDTDKVVLCVAQGKEGLRRPTALESRPNTTDLLLVLKRPKRE